MYASTSCHTKRVYNVVTCTLSDLCVRSTFDCGYIEKLKTNICLFSPDIVDRVSEWLCCYLRPESGEKHIFPLLFCVSMVFQNYTFSTKMKAKCICLSPFNGEPAILFNDFHSILEMFLPQ